MKTASREVWILAVNQLLIRDWSLDLAEAGFDDNEIDKYWKDGLEPTAFVDWFAEKYDLIRFDKFDQHMSG